MSGSETDYLLKPVPSTNQFDDKESASRFGWSKKYNNVVKRDVERYWKLAVHFVGKDYIAEFLATFILMVFGTGSIAQVVLSEKQNGQWLSINLGWGFGIIFGCFVAMGITGAHMNPAVTLAMAILGRLPWKKVPGYFIAQFLGAFVSSAVVYGIYYDALHNYEVINGEHRSITTAGIWATYPQSFLSNLNGFFDQLFGTYLLVLGIVAICDERNTEPRNGLKPLMIGLLVVAIGATYGYNCGYAINPARDFSPRLFTFCAGWGTKVFTHHAYFFWIPVVAPMIGGILGALTYVMLVEMHHTVG